MKFKQMIIWMVSLVVGAVLGSRGLGWFNQFLDFIASASERAFQFVAILTLAKDSDVMAQISRMPETVYGHILGIIPNNPINPFLSGNELLIVIISAAIGIAAILGKTSENVKTLGRALMGL